MIEFFINAVFSYEWDAFCDSMGTNTNVHESGIDASFHIVEYG